MEENLRLSVSKTKTFEGCKKKYEFCYIQKLPRKDYEYHTFGKFCHSVLENFHKMYIEGCLLPFNIAMGDSYKKALAEFSDKMTVDMKKECWKIIDQYLRKISGKKDTVPKTNVIAVEKRFEFQVGDNIILNGAIDRIQLDDDNVIHVADYKTTKNKKYLKDDWFQLLTYAFVIAKEDPAVKKVRASYILLRHDFEYITTEFDIDDILKVEDKYVAIAKQIFEEKEFKPNPQILCRYCEYSDICPEGKTMLEPSKIYGEVTW